jgi:hypothetical protein
MTPAPTATQRGLCQYWNIDFPQVGEFRARNDPRRAMVRFRPKAKESSFPLNHRARIVVMATIMDSAPSPKIRRPAAITTMFP